MIKILIKNRTDFETLFNMFLDDKHVAGIGNDGGFDSIEEMEEFFGISLISEYNDGTNSKYVIDYNNDYTYDASVVNVKMEENAELFEHLEMNSWTATGFAFWDGAGPKEYPLLVTLSVENGFDRLGNISTRILDYTYLSDFETTSGPEKYSNDEEAWFEET